MIKKLPGLLFLDGRVNLYFNIVNYPIITSLTFQHEHSINHPPTLPTTSTNATSANADANANEC